MKSTGGWILGIGASHNGAAVLAKGGEIVVGIQEERLNRNKRAAIWAGRASLAVNYCLDHAGIGIDQVAAIGIATQRPQSDPRNVFHANAQLWRRSPLTPVLTYSHHLAHASGAFATSGYSEAAVLVVDGMGSPWADLDERERAVASETGYSSGWEHISIYYANGDGLTPIEKHLGDGMLLPPDKDMGLPIGEYNPTAFGKRMPRFRSIGGMYGAVAHALFGDELDGAGKAMGLAAFGSARFEPDEFWKLSGRRVEFLDNIPETLGEEVEPWPDQGTLGADLAASVQAALTSLMLELAERARILSGCRNLCLAGGVALNGMANEEIIQRTGFRSVYIIPPAEDSGTAIGALSEAARTYGEALVVRRLERDSFGASYSIAECLGAMRDIGVCEPSADTSMSDLSAVLQQSALVGWFERGSELGPRALGHRSILSDPRSAAVKDSLNEKVKHREHFRPFAAIVLQERANLWFEMGSDPASPFMLRVVRVRDTQRSKIPAVCHADGTCRVQTISHATHPRLAALLTAFATDTGVPLLLNTSYNVAGEPIVETPSDAVGTAIQCGLDVIVLEGLIFDIRNVEFLDLVMSPRATSVHQPVDSLGRPQTKTGVMVSLTVPTPWGESVHAVRASEWELMQRFAGRTGHTCARMIGVERARVLISRWRTRGLIQLTAPGRWPVGSAALASSPR